MQLPPCPYNFGRKREESITIISKGEDAASSFGGGHGGQNGALFKGEKEEISCEPRKVIKEEVGGPLEGEGKSLMKSRRRRDHTPSSFPWGLLCLFHREGVSFLLLPRERSGRRDSISSEMPLSS